MFADHHQARGHATLRGFRPALLLGLLLAACDLSATRPAALLSPVAVPSAPAQAISPAAKAYLDHALTLMQSHALQRDIVDWPTLRSAAFVIAGTAQTPAETYDAIRYALANLYDGHSYSGVLSWLPLASR